MYIYTPRYEIWKALKRRGKSEPSWFVFTGLICVKKCHKLYCHYLRNGKVKENPISHNALFWNSQAYSVNDSI